ncbi:MAG: hypothetical protein ACLFPL_01805 [Candidatus Nanoarchaeia archaeon]
MSKTKFSLKQAISPIVSILLLISITVIISLGTYSFLQDYVEQTYNTISTDESLDEINTRIISATREKAYIQTPYKNITTTNVLLDGNECTNNIRRHNSKTLELDLRNCSPQVSSSSTDLIIETTQDFLQLPIRLEEASTNYLDCSNLPGNWTSVPGNPYFRTNDFCVMQFEAKDVAGVATSQPSSTPWVNINFTNARSACTDLNTQHSSLEGTFKMITNREWMTIARNAEQQDQNWDSGTVGSGSMFRGHSDSSPDNALAVSDIGNYYDGTGNSAPSIERRVLELSNGEVIWDLGGNVREWVDLLENGNTIDGNACSGSDDFYSYFGNDGFNECSFNSLYSKDSAADTRYEMGPLGDYNADEGVGRIYSRDLSGRALLRGGDWDFGASAGAFAVGLFNAPSFTGANRGFRCSYEP